MATTYRSRPEDPSLHSTDEKYHIYVRHTPSTTFGLGNGNLLGPSNSTNGETKARARDQSPNEERRVRLGSLLSLDVDGLLIRCLVIVDGEAFPLGRGRLSKCVLETV